MREQFFIDSSMLSTGLILFDSSSDVDTASSHNLAVSNGQSLAWFTFEKSLDIKCLRKHRNYEHASSSKRKKRLTRNCTQWHAPTIKVFSFSSKIDSSVLLKWLHRFHCIDCSFCYLILLYSAVWSNFFSHQIIYLNIKSFRPKKHSNEFEHYDILSTRSSLQKFGGFSSYSLLHPINIQFQLKFSCEIRLRN